MIEFPITAFRNEVCCPWHDKHRHAMGAWGHSSTPSSKYCMCDMKGAEHTQLSHFSLWLNHNLFLRITFLVSLCLTLSNLEWVFFTSIYFPFFLALWEQGNTPLAFLSTFFVYLLLNIFFLPSWFQVLHTPNRFSQIQGHTLLWDSITVFDCLYINHMAKKYSSCKDVMDKAHKELKRTSYHISQFQLGLKSLIFSVLFIVPLPQGRKEKVLLSCGSHTTTGIQHTLPCPKFLKDSGSSEVFREISGVMRTFSGAWLRKRDSFFLLISSLKYYWSYGPTSTVPRSSQIHMLTLGCSHFLGLEGFQDFIWSFHSSSLSLLTCGTEFSYVHTVHEKKTLSSYIADTASVIK